MSNYRRLRIAGGTYFFTVNLRERRPNDLLVRHVDVLRDAVREVRQRWPFRIDGWVVLPDHLHCIWTLPEGNADFAGRWRLIKALSPTGFPPPNHARPRGRLAASEASGNAATESMRSATTTISPGTWTTCISIR